MYVSRSTLVPWSGPAGKCVVSLSKLSFFELSGIPGLCSRPLPRKLHQGFGAPLEKAPNKRATFGGHQVLIQTRGRWW